MSALVPEDLLINDNNRRSWKQGVLICLGLLVAAGLIAGSIRLSSFEDAVESIVRIEVPAGVLADLTIETLETEVRDGVNETQNLQENKEVFELHPAGPARNILLVGTDSAVGLDSDDPAANRDRSAGIGLADTIMLVRLDPALPKASIMSLPRDLYVPIYRDGLSIRSEKLASALLVGGIEKGAPTLVETITNNFNVPIHNFAIVDFFGFEKLVDELSGVPLWFPYPVRDLASGLTILEQGCSVLDGRESLAFVRSRKMEAFVDGDWQRVGVWNDLERNKRQQDFLIRTIQRGISKGARSVLIRDDLVRAGAEAVVFDDRLTIAELLKLGRAFSEFQPESLQRHVLPVEDSLVGTSEVLQLGENANAFFGVFRGESASPESFSITAVDSRTKNEDTEEIFEELKRKGFSVEFQKGEVEEKTVIYSSSQNYDAAVLLGRFIEPIPDFKFNEKLKKEVILVLGNDFETFPLIPKTFEEVDVKSRSALPVLAELFSDNEEALSHNGYYSEVIPARQGDISPMRLVKEIDGQPPVGYECS
jgi:LCP family protein required for cell wall assembly